MEKQVLTTAENVETERFRPACFGHHAGRVVDGDSDSHPDPIPAVTTLVALRSERAGANKSVM